MKKYILNIFTALMSIAGLSGCSYLDVVPDDTATLADAFKNENTAENFVYSCYGYIPNYMDYRTGNYSWMVSNEFACSYHWGTQWFPNLQIQQGLYSSTNPVIDIWRNTYQGIRQCYTFLNNIDVVTPITLPQSEFEAKKKVWKAEVKFLIAYYHYLLLQNYGPVCIVKEEIPLTGSGDNIFLKRSPYDTCVQEIAAMFDEAIQDLPTTVGSADYGRATKVAAQALKSRMYLFAASPLFNGNSEYYSTFKNKDGELLISQAYDKEKWKKAMDETQKAIDMAESAGYALYEYKSDKPLNDFEQAVANTRYTMIDKWNKELIWGYTGTKETAGNGNNYQTSVIKNVFRNRATPPFGGIGPTLTAVEMFYSKNGIPAEEDPTFDWENRFTIAEGDSTIKLHRNREPRFYACVGYDRGDYEINEETVTLYMKFGEKNGCMDLNTDHLYTGYAVKKGVHPAAKVTNTTFSIEIYPFPIIRLGELYINYAEACAEYTGSLDNKALGYINAIRRKAGIPDFQTAFGNLSGNKLINAIHREKMIEFIFEGHWLYDLKRWKKAEEFFAPDAEGMRGLVSVGKTNEEFYKDTRLIGRPFVFTRKQHLHPINNVDITVNHNLVQNPGW